MCNCGIKAIFKYRVRTLHHNAENALQHRNLLKQLLFTLKVNYEKFRVFHSFNEEIRRFLFRKAANIAYPPIFNRKLQNHLVSILVYIILFQAAFNYKRFKFADFALSQQQRFLFKSLVFKPGMKNFEFFGLYGSTTAYVLVYFLKHLPNIEMAIAKDLTLFNFSCSYMFVNVTFVLVDTAALCFAYTPSGIRRLAGIRYAQV
jgi:hypothetical protein